LIIETSGFVLNFKPLSGFTKKYEKPVFTFKNWFCAYYQDSLTVYENNNTIIRSPLIRIYNEYIFRAYKKTKSSDVVIGKNNQCFQIDYIREYTGEYFVGEDLINQRCQRIKYIQDTLNKLGIKLIVVFAPGKASYMPENIPDHLKKTIYPENNYRCFVKTCNNMGIEMLDLQNYFNSIKDTVSWPLYPTYGIHWSDYGMYLALDTFVNRIQVLTGKNVPNITISGIEKSNIPRGQDYDMGEVLNLYSNLSETTLAYPKFTNADTCKPELKTLFVGDSFLFHWFKYGAAEYLYKSYRFWYYNVMVYPDFYKKELYNYQTDMAEEITSSNLVVLECTERFLYTAFWNFEEIAYKMFKDNYETDALLYHQNDIFKDHAQFIKVFDDAVKNGLLFRDALNKEAAKRAELLKPGTIEFYEYNIRRDPKWLDKVTKQANEQGIPVDEAIRGNAQWMLDQEKSKGK
jgi:hypothetical protein